MFCHFFLLRPKISWLLMIVSKCHSRIQADAAQPPPPSTHW